MRKVLIALAATAAAFASPAMANEGRIEARGGVVWDGGASEDVWGVAAGYDWDLGLGATARFGVKAGEKTKLFVDGGYTVNTCTACEDAIHAGVGAEVGVGSKVYLKAGYRHFFVANGFSDYDAVVAGVGVRF
jgi:outer membrane immunogenic protein